MFAASFTMEVAAAAKLLKIGNRIIVGMRYFIVRLPNFFLTTTCSQEVQSISYRRYNGPKTCSLLPLLQEQALSQIAVQSWCP